MRFTQIERGRDVKASEHASAKQPQTSARAKHGLYTMAKKVRFARMRSTPRALDYPIDAQATHVDMWLHGSMKCIYVMHQWTNAETAKLFQVVSHSLLISSSEALSHGR